VKVLVILLAILMAAGCQDMTSVAVERFANDGELVVRSRAGTLILSNQTDRRLHYVALEEETSSRVDLHFDVSAWPAIEPGGEARLRHDELMGYSDLSKRAVVYWSDTVLSGHLTVDLR
jgi:hypothetical protein